MTYALITPPVGEALTLAELKAHLRIDGNSENDLLEGLIRVAREHLERETGLSLLSQQWRLYLDQWPQSGVVMLERGPVRSVEAIHIFDADGMESEAPLAGMVLDTASRPARLMLGTRPEAGRAMNGIEVDFTAGFGDSGAEVPDGLKRAMLLHAALLWEFRAALPLEMQPASVPAGYERLVAPYRIRRL
jgi:uncharacterized phiE125 gp8 family phage protein